MKVDEYFVTFRNVVEAVKILKFRGRILKVCPKVTGFDIKLTTKGLESTCYLDFLIEMRTRGYNLSKTKHKSDVHFYTVIKKIKEK